MPILTKEVEVKLNSRTAEYYKSLGYEIPMRKATESTYKKYKKEFVYDFNKTIKVKVEDLPSGSGTKVDVLCDYCLNEILTMTCNQYTKRTKYIDKIACRNCYAQKIKETSLLLYGVNNYAQTKECRDKMEFTSKEKYGTSSYSQTEEFKKRYHDTCIERYGENYSQQFSQKAFKTFYEKTGYNHPSQSPEIKEKKKQISFDRYGAEISLKSPEIREKVAQTYYSNSSKIASKQQQYICNLYEGILNFPVKYYNVDICLPNDNLIIEYDGGGHFLGVITGRETMEEQKRKEIIRYSVIKNEGYKQMRIISTTDRLPSDQILLQMLNDAKQYFSTTSHSWISYNIDNSKMINAENKNIDGVFYNYGELRAIKEIA